MSLRGPHCWTRSSPGTPTSCLIFRGRALAPSCERIVPGIAAASVCVKTRRFGNAVSAFPSSPLLIFRRNLRRSVIEFFPETGCTKHPHCLSERQYLSESPAQLGAVFPLLNLGRLPPIQFRSSSHFTAKSSPVTVIVSLQRPRADCDP